ncbi:transglutaminase-like domain-containing protein [Mycoplasmopsis lipophila]|uniref:transglutaminase domain-containing protein n=1 Tax=Mycoplasmopsis lipophila TaxID=2117 RepID=UPI0038738340
MNTPNRYEKEQYASIRKMVVENLTKIIFKKFSTKRKVRAIFNWIMHRINYVWEEYYQDKNQTNWNIRNPYALTEEIVNDSTLKQFKDKGVCETYAILFLLFAMFANIKSGYIMGNVGQE